MNKTIKAFKIVGILEAVSLLVLLAIAMPLKYFMDSPEMVKMVGSIHGGLFLLYVAMAIYVSMLLKWNLKTLAIVIFCSFIPFGPFYADKKFLP